jgi:hypothetical protein
LVPQTIRPAAQESLSLTTIPHSFSLSHTLAHSHTHSYYALNFLSLFFFFLGDLNRSLTTALPTPTFHSLPLPPSLLLSPLSSLLVSRDLRPTSDFRLTTAHAICRDPPPIALRLRPLVASINQRSNLSISINHNNTNNHLLHLHHHHLSSLQLVLKSS